MSIARKDSLIEGVFPARGRGLTGCRIKSGMTECVGTAIAITTAGVLGKRPTASISPILTLK